MMVMMMMTMMLCELPRNRAYDWWIMDGLIDWPNGFMDGFTDFFSG